MIYFEDDGTQNYFICEPVCRCFKKIVNSNNLSLRKYKGLSDEGIKPTTITNSSLAPALSHIKLN